MIQEKERKIFRGLATVTGRREHIRINMSSAGRGHYLEVSK